MKNKNSKKQIKIGSDVDSNIFTRIRSRRRPYEKIINKTLLNSHNETKQKTPQNINDKTQRPPTERAHYLHQGEREGQHQGGEGVRLQDVAVALHLVVGVALLLLQ